MHLLGEYEVTETVSDKAAPCNDPRVAASDSHFTAQSARSSARD